MPKPTRRTVALSAAPMFPAYEELMDEQDGSGAAAPERLKVRVRQHDLASYHNEIATYLVISCAITRSNVKINVKETTEFSVKHLGNAHDQAAA